MEITLRKASALQSEAARLLTTSKYDIWTVHVKPINATNVEVYNEFVIEKRLAAEDIFKSRNALIDAIQEVRMKVSAANKNVGIDDLLAEMAAISAKLGELPSDSDPFMVKLDPTPYFNEVKNDLERAAKNVSGWPSTDTTDINLLDADLQAQMAEDYRKLTRRRQAIKDRLMELNASNTITLSRPAYSSFELATLI